MSCSNQLYITLFIVLIFILIFINFKVCKYNKSHKIDKINIIESFTNKFVYGLQDKDTSKYLFACVDRSGNLNQYYVPGDGSMWSDAVKFAETGRNKPPYVIEANSNASWSESGSSFAAPGILCANNNDNIFKWLASNINDGDSAGDYDGDADKFNSYGSGTNSTEAVTKILYNDISAPNFANNCTKERWYLFKERSGRDYIYAVFKRNPWTSDLVCCSNNNIQRNSCNDRYTDINSTECNNYMQNYCGNGANITLDVCKNWCSDSKNSSTCKNYQLSFCNNGTNFQNNFDFCHASCDNQKCDIGVTNYCKNNLGDNNFCACFLDNAKKNADSSLISTLGDLKLAEADPVCYSSQCRNGYAYQTQTMKTSIEGCPKCLQKMTLTNLTKAEDIKQSCNVNINNTTTSTSALPTQTLPTPAPQTQYQPQPQLPIQKPMPEMTLSDYLDQFTKLLNDILDSIANLF